MQARLAQRLNVMWVLLLALMMTSACVVKKPTQTAQAKPDSPPPAQVQQVQKVQAMYFSADVEPLDATHCGSWGAWDICFAPSAPLAQQERCAAQSMFERCERSVITPLVCKHATEGESGCQIIRTAHTNVIGQREEQCDVARGRTTMFSIRCPARLQLAPADLSAVAMKDMPPQPQQ